jgi:uncharacterized protein YbaR (Trm112 family)
MKGLLSELTDLLRCPITGQPLHIATPEELRSFSAKMSHDTDGLLVREDGSAAYPVMNGIPSLLAESLIPLQSLT